MGESLDRLGQQVLKLNGVLARKLFLTKRKF